MIFGLPYLISFNLQKTKIKTWNKLYITASQSFMVIYTQFIVMPIYVEKSQHKTWCRRTQMCPNLETNHNVNPCIIVVMKNSAHTTHSAKLATIYLSKYRSDILSIIACVSFASLLISSVLFLHSLKHSVLTLLLLDFCKSKQKAIRNRMTLKRVKVMAENILNCLYDHNVMQWIIEVWDYQ